MNPVKIFHQLVRNTLFNSGASAFLQAISGHVPDSDATRLLKNLKHIQKEAGEGIAVLEEAIKAGVVGLTAEQTNQVRDAYADVRVLLDGATQMANFPWEEDYKRVLTSLITRFDPTMEDAVKTQDKYALLDVVTRIHNDSETGMFVNIVEDGTKSVDPTEYPTGKWLKSYKFQEPTFTPWHPVVNISARETK